MPSERGRNIAVGLTALAGLLGFVALIVLFGYLPGFVKSGYRVTIELPTAEGLHSGSQVRLNGIGVGEVESVQLSPQLNEGVRVKARIDQQQLPIPQTVRARLSSPLLGGGSKVDLVVGASAGKSPKSNQAKQGDSAMLARDGSAVIAGKSGSLTDQITNELVEAMAEPTRQFEELTQTIKGFTTVWRKVGVNVRKMTDPRTPSDVDAGKVLGNVASVVTRIDRRLAEMKTTMEQLNKWVGDKELRTDVKTTVRRVSSASAKIEQTLTALEKQATALSDDLARVTGSASRLFKKAENGSGTLGKVLGDPALYDNLNDAASRMKSAVDEVRLLVEKWKKEGLPVQF